jgi:hypothetical protein
MHECEFHTLSVKITRVSVKITRVSVKITYDVK